ncbi:MAG: hypothetical protein M3Q86_02910 [Verrucomicrobiota bacterium]|nr:hypothetical protein [Verrucomicrobiota bacterium]
MRGQLAAGKTRRKASQTLWWLRQASHGEGQGSGLAIAAGALLDGIPESMVIGLSLLGGEKIGLGLVGGFFLANLPQGLSSASGMKTHRKP